MSTPTGLITYSKPHLHWGASCVCVYVCVCVCSRFPVSNNTYLICLTYPYGEKQPCQTHTHHKPYKAAELIPSPIGIPYWEFATGADPPFSADSSISFLKHNPTIREEGPKKEFPCYV
jgi:hypothetical protein